MALLFRELADDRHESEVRGRRGPDLRLPVRETGPTIPHDLAHLRTRTRDVAADRQQLARALAALDDARARRDALAVGEALRWQWRGRSVRGRACARSRVPVS